MQRRGTPHPLVWVIAKKVTFPQKKTIKKADNMAGPFITILDGVSDECQAWQSEPYTHLHHRDECSREGDGAYQPW